MSIADEHKLVRRLTVGKGLLTQVRAAAQKHFLPPKNTKSEIGAPYRAYLH